MLLLQLLFVKDKICVLFHDYNKCSVFLLQAYQYGVYTRELLQFGDKVSMLLLLPPSEDFSSSYWPLVGTKEPGLTMPLQVFELGKYRALRIPVFQRTVVTAWV